MTTFYPQGKDGDAVSIKVGDQTPTSGCYVDGHWGQYGASRVLRIADDLLGTDYIKQADKVRECEQCGAQEMVSDREHLSSVGCMGDRSRTHSWVKPEGMMTDEYPSGEFVSDLADEAEAELNAATDGGCWGWEDGEFFLRPDLEGRYFATVERVGNATHTQPEPYVYVSSVDGRDGPDWSPDVAYGMWRVDIGTVDVDGDEEGDEVFSVLAVWHGGCYVDLHASGGESMADVFGRGYPENVPWAADAMEVVYVEGVEKDGRTVRTVLDAERQVEAWVQRYIETQGTDEDSMEHDFGHYGFVLP